MLTTSAKQTFNLGKKLAAKLRGGEVLALTGPLGAGKTVFIKGLATGLGVKQIVTSPTFTLMKVYPLTYRPTDLPTYRPKNLVHLDCYRINDPQDIIGIGAPDYFGRPDTITVIEWAEKIKALLPAGQTIKIAIKLKNPLRRPASLRPPALPRGRRSEASGNKREIIIN